jgi:hypothetical protein
VTLNPDVYRANLPPEERVLLREFDTWLARTIPWLVGPKMGEADDYGMMRRHLWQAFLAGRQTVRR